MIIFLYLCWAFCIAGKATSMEYTSQNMPTLNTYDPTPVKTSLLYYTPQEALENLLDIIHTEHISTHSTLSYLSHPTTYMTPIPGMSALQPHWAKVFVALMLIHSLPNHDLYPPYHSKKERAHTKLNVTEHTNEIFAKIREGQPKKVILLPKHYVQAINCILLLIEQIQKMTALNICSFFPLSPLSMEERLLSLKDGKALIVLQAHQKSSKPIDLLTTTCSDMANYLLGELVCQNSTPYPQPTLLYAAEEALMWANDPTNSLPHLSRLSEEDMELLKLGLIFHNIWLQPFFMPLQHTTHDPNLLCALKAVLMSTPSLDTLLSHTPRPAPVDLTNLNRQAIKDWHSNTRLAACSSKVFRSILLTIKEFILQQYPDVTDPNIAQLPDHVSISCLPSNAPTFIMLPVSTNLILASLPKKETLSNLHPQTAHLFLNLLEDMPKEVALSLKSGRILNPKDLYIKSLNRHLMALQ